MKKIISILYYGIIVLSLVSVVGCSSDDDASISVGNASANPQNPVAQGRSTVVTSTCAGDNVVVKCDSWQSPTYSGTGTWSSESPCIKDGDKYKKTWTLTPFSSGAITLQCKESDISGSSTVDITVAENSLALTPLSSYLEIGESVTLTATASQAVSNDTVVAFTPSNSSVISYSGEKKCTIKAGSKSCVVGVTAKADGTETVSVTAAGVATKNTAQIIVVEPSPSPEPTPTDAKVGP